MIRDTSPYDRYGTVYRGLCVTIQVEQRHPFFFVHGPHCHAQPITSPKNSGLVKSFYLKFYFILFCLNWGLHGPPVGKINDNAV